MELLVKLGSMKADTSVTVDHFIVSQMHSLDVGGCNLKTNTVT